MTPRAIEGNGEHLFYDRIIVLRGMEWMLWGGSEVSTGCTRHSLNIVQLGAYEIGLVPH